MQGSSFTMYFEGSDKPELVRSEFRPSGASGADALTAVRGKSAGAFPHFGSFQWTSGVRAVCVAFLRFAISEQSPGVDYCLIGSKGSLAASLDYALSKSPSWLSQMFGQTPAGGLFARRLFRITNPNRKRPGPVALSVNKTLLPGTGVAVLLDGEPVTSLQALHELLESVEHQGGATDELESESTEKDGALPRAMPNP